METYSRADVLSRLDIIGTNNSIKPNMSSLVEHFSLEKEDSLLSKLQNYYAKLQTSN